MDVKTIETAVNSGSEVEINIEIQQPNPEKQPKKRKRIKRKFVSFDQLTEQNEEFGEEYIAKLPIQLMEPSFENEVIAGMEKEFIRRAIKKFSEKQQRRIILRFYKNLKILQIAEIENTSFQAISKSIIKSLEKLKIFLEN